MNPEERKRRIEELQNQARERNILESIQSLTNALSSLNASYSLVLPNDEAYNAPFQWISEHFTTSSMHILWDGVENVQYFSWQEKEELQQVFISLLEDIGLAKNDEVQVVMGGQKPHIYVALSSLASIVGEASELEAEWWVIPTSKAWILECRIYGELWFYRLPNYPSR